MRVLVTTWVDAANLAIENIVRELVLRGHEVEVFAHFMDEKSIWMFQAMGLPIHSIRELTDDVISSFDVAFTAESAMRALKTKDIYVFSYNNIPDTWVTDGSDFMFTMVRDRQLRWYEDCATMPIGVAKNDMPVTHDEMNKQFLYIDAGHNPYGLEAKTRVAKMLLDICEAFPDYKLVVKPRWLLSDMHNQTHRTRIHIYSILDDLTAGKLPDNLVLLQEHRNLQELIDESHTVLSTSLSCYLDVALRDKGCIIPDGFGNEEAYDTRPSFRNTYKAARDAGVCVDYKSVLDYLPDGLACKSEHLKRRIPYRSGVSERIVNVIEYVYENYISQGIYPPVQNYEYETYQKALRDGTPVSFEELKEKRFKNGVLIFTRTMEYVSADLGYSDFYAYLCEASHRFPKSDAGFWALTEATDIAKKKTYVQNKDKMMSDAIDQSILLQALYDLHLHDEILSIPEEEILCEGPYHFHMGWICAAQPGSCTEAMEHLCLFLKEANSRSYNKYPQETDNCIRKAYNFIFEHYDGVNLPAEDFSLLYLGLFEIRNPGLVPLQLRERVRRFMPHVEEPLHHVSLKINRTFLRIGQWTYKKARGGFRCLRDNGVKYTVRHGFGKVRRKLSPLNRKIRGSLYHINNKSTISTPVKIWQVFNQKVLGGYHKYAEIYNKYGPDMRVYLTAPSRGDGYIIGSLFPAYLNRHGDNKRPVFLVWSPGGAEAAKLFPIDNVECLMKQEEMKELFNLYMFDTKSILPITFLHFHAFYRHTGIFGYMMGLHGFNLFSLSAAAIDVDESEAVAPRFSNDEKAVEDFFSKYGLPPHWTVILAPHAKTVKKIRLPFWKRLTAELHYHGFMVCTNVFGKEEPIPETVRVNIPFETSVPILEKAGITIGLRSGFQDVTCSADCLKFSIQWKGAYTPFLCTSVEEAFDLSEMYHDPKQHVLLYEVDKENAVIEEIISVIKRNYKPENGEGILSLEAPAVTAHGTAE